MEPNCHPGRCLRIQPPAPVPLGGSTMCHPPRVSTLLAPGDTWLQHGHWQQLDEVPTVEAEETVVISDIASQGDDVAGVLQAGG